MDGKIAAHERKTSWDRVLMEGIFLLGKVNVKIGEGKGEINLWRQK